MPFLDNGLYAPKSYCEASPEEIAEKTNGCGSADSLIDFVPDTIWGLSICEPCNIHDWMYGRGRTIKDKKEADRVFFNNMLRVIEQNTSNSILKWLRKRRALKYYKAVSWFGGPAFWKGKPDAPGAIV